MRDEQLIDEFSRPPKGYILHNAQPKPLQVGYGGNLWTLPPADEYSADPGIDADGDLIPGTLVIRDTFMGQTNVMGVGGYAGIPSGDGNDVDAGIIVRFLLGYDRTTKKATSSHAQAGLSLIPSGATKETINSIRRAGAEKWERKDIDNCYSVVKEYEERTERLGVKPPMTQEMERALAKLNAHRAKYAQKIAPTAIGEESPDDELELLAFTKAKAFELAATASDNLSAEGKAAVVAKIMEDPKAMELIRKSYRVAKKGKAEPDSAALRKMVEQRDAVEKQIAEAGEAVDFPDAQVVELGV